MPFTFKPEISDQANGQAPAASMPSVFGSSQPNSLMQRAEEIEGRSLIVTVLTGIFGLTVLIAIGMFGYSYYLSSQIESKKATLASYESQLGNLPLEDMRSMSNRIKVINQLVKEHPSANVAFRILEDSIENNITYKKFDLHYTDATKTYQLSLGGLSPDYKSIVQQYDTLTRKPYSNYLQKVTVDSLAPEESGNVNFSMRMNIMIAGLLPEKVTLSEGAAAFLASSTPSISEDVSASSTETAPPTQ